LQAWLTWRANESSSEPLVWVHEMKSRDNSGRGALGPARPGGRVSGRRS